MQQHEVETNIENTEEYVEEGNNADESREIEAPMPELDEKQRIGALESLLFSIGNSVEISKLADCLEISEAETEECLDALEKRYKAAQSGLELVRLENSVQLGTKRDYFGVLKKLVATPRRYTLSETVLETLSIIAYKQPVTRLEIEKIRGVSCGHQINRLLEFDLIRELGRLDAPGKPLLFGTTEQFLKSFGVASIDELPQASPDRIADFQAEAEKEVQEIKI